MNQHTPIPRPTHYPFILFTLVLAVLLELIPLPYGGLLWLPDFIALALLFWVIHEPNRINIGAAFFLGMVSDLINASLLGQHSLAYVITAYLALLGQRRLILYNAPQQALVVLGLLLLNQITMYVIRLLAGAEWLGWGYFLPSLIGALLWPMLIQLIRIRN